MAGGHGRLGAPQTILSLAGADSGVEHYGTGASASGVVQHDPPSYLLSALCPILPEEVGQYPLTLVSHSQTLTLSG